jgi:outer membrane protein
MKHKLPNLKHFAVCLLLFTVTGVAVHAQEVISLQRAVDLALERNLTIKQAQFNEALTEQDLKQSKYNRLPDLNAGPQASFNFGRNIDPSTNQFTNQRIFGLSGNMTSQLVLFQGGQLRNQILQNKILLDADKSNTAKVRNDLVLNVVTTYLSILTNQDLVLAAQQQIDIARLGLERTDKSFKAGNLTLADLSQSRSQLSTNELNLTNAQNQLGLSILTLKQYMEMNPATEITIVKPDISKLQNINTTYDPEAVLKTAMGINPDVLLAEIRARAYEQGIKVARGNYYPSVVMFGSLGTNYSDARIQSTGKFRITGVDTIGTISGTNQYVTSPRGELITKRYPFGSQIGDNFNQSIGVSLQIPIFNRFSARTSVNKAKINYENAQVGAQLARNNLSKTIYQAVWDLQSASKKYQSATQTYQANKDAFDAVQKRYNVGLLNSLDFNTSLTNLNRSQFDMIQAQYEMIFRSKIIDYYLGNPITL